MTGISILSPLAGIAFYLFLKKFDCRVTNLTAIILLVSFIADVLAKALAVQDRSSLIVFNVYFPLNLVLVLILYYEIYLKYDSLFRYLLIIPFSVAMLMSALFLFSTDDDNISWVLCTIVIEIMAFGHLRRLGMDEPVYKIHLTPEFWITVGLFIYSSVSFFIFTLEKYLLHNYSIDIFRSVWLVHNLLNICKSGCLATAIWWAAKRNPEFDNITTGLMLKHRKSES